MLVEDYSEDDEESKQMLIELAASNEDRIMLKVSQSVYDMDIRKRVSGSFGAMDTVFSYMRQIEKTEMQ